MRHMPASHAMPPQHIEDDRDDDERAAIQESGTPLLRVPEIAARTAVGNGTQEMNRRSTMLIAIRVSSAVWMRVNNR